MQRNVKHTPGPWGTANMTEGRCSTPQLYVISESEQIARISHIQGHGRQGEAANIDERIANARLIAAAPELLAACKVLLRFVGDVPDPNDCEKIKAAHVAVMAIGRVAVAKAEGN